MATTPNKTDKPEVNTLPSKEMRVLHLKAREKNIQDKISNRIPKFPKTTRDAALERAQNNLDDIRKEIKAAS